MLMRYVMSCHLLFSPIVVKEAHQKKKKRKHIYCQKEESKATIFSSFTHL